MIQGKLCRSINVISYQLLTLHYIPRGIHWNFYKAYISEVIDVYHSIELAGLSHKPNSQYHIKSLKMKQVFKFLCWYDWFGRVWLLCFVGFVFL